AQLPDSQAAHRPRRRLLGRGRGRPPHLPHRRQGHAPARHLRPGDAGGRGAPEDQGAPAEAAQDLRHRARRGGDRHGGQGARQPAARPLLGGRRGQGDPPGQGRPARPRVHHRVGGRRPHGGGVQALVHRPRHLRRVRRADPGRRAGHRDRRLHRRDRARRL
ncbi:MAG: hypothetical protein AVDCRST_MAG13-2248, partial [uncultured Solirubrobacteraceae bacterium]